jgi:hypothetical protein
MFYQWLTTATLVLITCFSSTVSIAQSLSDEQSSLSSYEKRLLQQQANKQQLQDELARNEAKLAPLLSQPHMGKADLDAVKLQLDTAKTVFDKNPNAENKAKYKNVEFKYVLAERKFKKSNTKLFELQTSSQRLSKKLSAVTANINTLTLNIAQQTLKVNQTRNKQQATIQAQREQEQKLQAAADSAEIARLKAELTQQRRKEETRTAVAAANKAEQKATEALAASAKATATANRAAASAATPATTANSARLITSADQLKAELQRIDEIIASNDPDKNRKGKRSKKLKIKTVLKSGKPGRTKKMVTLRALGQEQYRGTVRLSSGKIIFELGKKQWHQQVPSGSTNKQYIIMLDGSDSENLQLIYFLKSLKQR